MVHDGRWDELIRKVTIRKGDFFQINPGTVHAIKAGTLILETQQSSDITYRLYDYGHLQNGKAFQYCYDDYCDYCNAGRDSWTDCNIMGEQMIILLKAFL